ncbi:MAG: NHLP-related RiPP peptide [Pseudoxanthomonas sp.]
MHANAINFDSTTSSSEKISARISPQVADRLLELLGTDDVFRQLFKNDPKQALLKVGFVEPASEISPVYCLTGIEKLASKDVIIQSRESIKAYLTAGLGMTPIQLNARSSNASFKRK